MKPVIKSRKVLMKEHWISPSLWKRIVEVLPLACVDVLLQRDDSSILYGWRLINPYNDVWALPGGRVWRGESIKQCARRIAKEYGLRFQALCLIGVFPIKFPRRSDISIAVAALQISGEPEVDGFEFSRFAWMKAPPQRLGANYKRMVSKWQSVSGSKDFLRLNQL
jgi:ADP-ribose pyrophosphatase YjhB (NUDIX family)